MSSTSRRTFLRTAASCAAMVALPAPAIAQIEAAALRTKIDTTRLVRSPSIRRLHIKIQHSGDVFNDTYGADGNIYDDAVAEIDTMMRDWRNDEIITIDRDLIDLLANVQERIGYDEPMMLISCYRSKTTNDMLRKRSRRVAKNSFHTKGMAVDFRVKGVPIKALRMIGREMKAGGVGYYPRNNFIHLDTGPVRSWRG